MKPKSKSKHIIFYSWQSDLPKETNLNGIRKALRDAASMIELDNENIIIELDEATRNTAGSPNIPETIFKKILASDVFVCDVTTINAKAEDGFRKSPNPNVLIELGYAIATLGWDRIIMLFNENYGIFPNDLPFDIDRHRTAVFNIKDKNDNEGKKKLAELLKIGVKAIIDKSPLKPAEKKNEPPEVRKKRIDSNNLELVLSCIHIPTFDQFIEEMPHKIIGRIFYFEGKFNAILDSNLFHIYDEDLLQMLIEFKANWNRSLSYYEHYGSDGTGKNFIFQMKMDIFPSKEAEKDFGELIKIGQELKRNFRDLIVYVRTNYLQIDIEKTSKKAFEQYKEDME